MAINNQPTIKPITVTGLFTKYIAKVIPLAFDESMSYYECLCALLDYINKNVIPALDNNAEGLEELQGFYVELQSYVNNYFDNLDVQEEINNKLDAMVKSGVLEQIIEQYINSSATWGYDTVQDMKEATNLINGSYARTLGYYSLNDGGESLYKITDTASETEYQEELESGLYATLIVKNNMINIKQFGAKGDGENDDTLAIQNAINYFHVGTDEDDQNYETVLLRNYPDAGGTIYFPKGVYCISSTIKIPCYVDVDFGYSTIKAISGGTFINNYMFSVNSYSLNSWTYAYAGRKGFIKNAIIDGNDITNICGFYMFDPHKIENIQFSKLYNSLKYGIGPSNYIDGIYINRVTISECKGSEYQILKKCQGDGAYLNNIEFEAKVVNGIKITSGQSGKLQNIINGVIYLLNTDDYSISNWHCEYGHLESRPRNNLTIRDSNIYVRGNSTPIILTDGSNNDDLRTSFIENVKFVYYINTDDFNYETKDIDLSNYVGHIFLKGCYREEWVEGINKISQSGIQYYNGANYIQIPYDECEIYNKKLKPSNTTIRRDEFLFNGVSTYNKINWNLETRTYYYKMINFADIDKLCGRSDDEANVTISNVDNGVRISVAGDLGYGNIIRLYRGTETGVYTHYVDIPNPKCASFYDNGYSVNGYKWKSVDTAVDTFNTINFIERINIFTDVLVKCKGYSSPTVGTWKQGDIIERLNPSANGNLGWVCTSAGTPGTWKEFGTIQS